MNIIDSHQHFWSLKRDDYGWLTPDNSALYQDFMPEDLRPILLQSQVVQTVLVQAAPTIQETKFLLELANDCNFVAGVVGWIAMDDESFDEGLAMLASDECLVGIRPMIQDIADPAWIVDPMVQRSASAIAAHDLTFDALVQPAQLPYLIDFVTAQPNLRVVVDHGAKPNIGDKSWQPWANHIAEIARNDNVYCKLSGLVTEAGHGAKIDDLRRYSDHLLASFGPERMLWGSDWPVVTMACSYGDWLTITEALLSGLDDNQRTRVMADNAARFYNLDSNLI